MRLSNYVGSSVAVMEMTATEAFAGAFRTKTDARTRDVWFRCEFVT
jgi:hypothetical protein